MADPDWRHAKAGARVRVALWLKNEVGEGNIFTKAQLRSAFPFVEQIDRRMRDLRAEGWVITTYREDRSLAAEELRLVEVGGHVWVRGYSSRAERALTDNERRRVLAADNYCCRVCGIAAGEDYPDDKSKTAKLSVQRVSSQGRGSPLARTLCDRCRVGGTAGLEPPSEESLLARISELPPEGVARLASWMAAGCRELSAEQRIWSEYLTMPPTSRKKISQIVVGAGPSDISGLER